MAVTRYDAEALLRRLPHRHPFVFLDRVEVEEPGRSGRGYSLISIANPVFAGHFPGRPIFPGVLLIEAAAQSAGVIATAADDDGTGIALLATVRKFAFRKPVLPGDLVVLTCELKASVGGFREFTCTVDVAQETRAEGVVAVAIETSDARM
ncbi:3-hydroxyacyl-ACP dehydratase FabZ [Microbacterium paulum]